MKGLNFGSKAALYSYTWDQSPPTKVQSFQYIISINEKWQFATIVIKLARDWNRHAVWSAPTTSKALLTARKQIYMTKAALKNGEGTSKAQKKEEYFQACSEISVLLSSAPACRTALLPNPSVGMGIREVGQTASKCSSCVLGCLQEYQQQWFLFGPEEPCHKTFANWVAPNLKTILYITMLTSSQRGWAVGQPGRDKL